jgi:hypothetical protein
MASNLKTALLIGLTLSALGPWAGCSEASAPLFERPQDVPSVVRLSPAPQYAAAVEHARELVRAGVQEQGLPGVSVAVGAGSALIWAEGFGWRDVGTLAPMTPETRFNIGTAATAITPAEVDALGLTSTGAEAAAAWSPEHIGEPGEDFPLFTIVRHRLLQPLGLAPAEYPLPAYRATFYVPLVDGDPRRGRRLMPMRNLACCAGTLASYSTASDMVQVGLTRDSSVIGELAGGTVMSLTARHDGGVVVAVLSNIAHADTATLAQQIAEAFSTHAR